MTTSGRLLRSAIREAAAASPDCVAFRARALEALRASVPFDAACLGLLDPAVHAPTALTTVGYDVSVYPTVLDIEWGEGDEPTRFESLRRRPVPVRTLREATADRVRSCRFWADVLAPAGLDDEVRMVFRTDDGVVWGGCTLARSGAAFTEEEVARLRAALGEVADGLRTTLFRAAARLPATEPDGPAVAVVSAGGEVRQATGAALEWFERLAWQADDRPAPTAPAAVAAAWLRRSGRQSVALRARTRDGDWVLVRAGWQQGSADEVVMTVERAHLPDVAALAALAFGLTPRESEVLTHLLAGESRQEIAASLVISPWTVQDHLRSVYAKTGTNGRRGLVALLVRTEYVPRLGTAVGADGWFSPAPSPATPPPPLRR